MFCGTRRPTALATPEPGPARRQVLKLELLGVDIMDRAIVCRQKCGLGRSNDSRILRGPFEKRRDRPLERPAQIGEGIFDSQSAAKVLQSTRA
jgi:hypothetical protein